MKTKRIDQYICIDADQIIVDEMTELIESNCGSVLEEDQTYWKELQEAAKVILKNYTT